MLSIILRFLNDRPRVVNAIPYVAMQKGLLTNDKQNKLNVFSGRIMEIEGLPDLKIVEQLSRAKC